MSFYAGKKVFITGGSAGIGRAMALQLAKQGASIIVAARGKERLDETVEAMKEAVGGNNQVFDSISVDVTDAQAMRDAAEQTMKVLGGIDVLICNSGYAQTGTTDNLSDEDFENLLNVNYLGHVHTVRAFLPHFIQQKSGNICLVSSMLAFFSTWGYGAYSASKYAIAGFAEALRQEMMLRGVKVTLFYPPTTVTPGLDRENEDKPPVLLQLEMDNSFTKVYQAEPVAASILEATRKGKFEAYIGWDTWLVFTILRHFPRLGRWLNDNELKTAIKKVEAKGGSTEGEAAQH